MTDVFEILGLDSSCEAMKHRDNSQGASGYPNLHWKQWQNERNIAYTQGTPNTEKRFDHLSKEARKRVTATKSMNPEMQNGNTTGTDIYE